MLILSFTLPRSWSIALILKEVLLFSYKQRHKFAPQWNMFVLSWLSDLVWIKASASVKIIYTDNLTCLQISIEGVRGPTFSGDIAVDSIEVTPGRCKLVFSEEEIQSDSHLALGKDLLFVMFTLLALKYPDLCIYHSNEYSHQVNQPYSHTVGSVSGGVVISHSLPTIGDNISWDKR